MSRLYQRLDAPHFDYVLYTPAALPNDEFRGPAPDLSRPYAAFIGGAQTFGRFVARPFAQAVADELGMQCLNLGIGGAGPRFALQPPVLELLNGAAIVVVQFFSGRSASCTLFDNGRQGRNSGKYLPTGKHMSYEQFFKNLLARAEPALVERIVRETREDYAHSMREVAAAIKAPKVALWISRRRPEYEKNWVERYGWMNFFPQLLDETVVAACAPAFDSYVECVAKVGLPQRLWRAAAPVEGAQLGADGWLYNEYYPSPEMNELASTMLVPVCSELLARRAAAQPR
ncbi:MAG: hypothetical protein RL398_2930 [Planctomycetota bacterium]|jgi:hypothetical protein